MGFTNLYAKNMHLKRLVDLWDRARLDAGSITDWGMTITSGTSAPSAVPEPGEWAAMGVLGFGLVGLVVRGRRRLTN